MNNTSLGDAIYNATRLIEQVNATIPVSENLINKGIQTATKELNGQDLKFAQKKQMQIQALVKDAKAGKDISAQVKALSKQVEAKYKK
jgi:hypothetical protein